MLEKLLWLLKCVSIDRLRLLWYMCLVWVRLLIGWVMCRWVCKMILMGSGWLVNDKLVDCDWVRWVDCVLGDIGCIEWYWFGLVKWIELCWVLFCERKYDVFWLSVCILYCSGYLLIRFLYLCDWWCLLYDVWVCVCW